WRITLVAAFAGTASACTGAVAKAPDTRERASRTVTSNVQRKDYAGSESCRGCHLEVYERWAGSPMRRMTRNAEAAEVRAPFDGRSFHFMGDTARLERVGDERFIAVDSKYDGEVRYRVTRVVGGRTREDFVGV